LKICAKCKQKKEINDFYKSKISKDGAESYCKKCKLSYARRYKEHKREYDKKRRERLKNDPKFIKKGKELYKRRKIKGKVKKYIEKNKEWIKNYRQKYLINFANYKSYNSKIELFEQTRKDPNNENLLQVKCTNCRKWFNPRNIDIQNRIAAINGKFTQGTENRLYCTDDCKQICSIYHTQIFPKDFIDKYCKKWKNKDFKEIIKYRDCYICQNEDCWKKVDDLNIHHIDYNKENCDHKNLITVCKSCNSRANHNREYWQKYYEKRIKEIYKNNGQI